MAAVTALGRVRDLMILMQQKLEPEEVVLLTFTGASPAGELYVLNRKTNEVHTIATFKTVASFNRWARKDLRTIMQEFI